MMNNHVGEMTVPKDDHHGFYGCGDPECMITNSSETNEMINDESN